MALEVEATYANGTLRLDEPLPLRENERVVLNIQRKSGRADPVVDSASFRATIHAELDALKRLAPNWDQYGAPAINSETIAAARKFIDALPPNVAYRPCRMAISSSSGMKAASRSNWNSKMRRPSATSSGMKLMASRRKTVLGWMRWLRRSH